MGPRQLSRHCRDKFTPGIGLIELLHSVEVRAGESAEAGLGMTEVLCQIVDDTLSPVSEANLLADDPAYLPVEVDQFLIHGLEGTGPARLNEVGDLGEGLLFGIEGKVTHGSCRKGRRGDQGRPAAMGSGLKIWGRGFAEFWVVLGKGGT